MGGCNSRSNSDCRWSYAGHLSEAMIPFDSKGRFTFGKHKGKPYVQVAFQHAAYCLWCMENIDGFKEAADALQSPETGTKKNTKKTASKKPTLQARLLDNIREIERALDDVPETPGELDMHTAHSPDTAPW